MERDMLKWSESSLFSAGSASYLEDLYEQFLENPNSVGQEWQAMFEGLPVVQDKPEIPHSTIKNYFKETTRRHRFVKTDSVSDLKQIGVFQLIDAYRKHGHRVADLDPLGLKPLEDVAPLKLAYHGLEQTDLDNQYIFDINAPANKLTLRMMLNKLKSTYCSSVGAEYLQLEQDYERDWVKEWLEIKWKNHKFDEQDSQKLLSLLTAAEGLEKYIGAKFPGAKRFGLEGGDSLIPLLNEMIQGAGNRDCKEIVIGMAHRGRLNVLVNLIGKLPQELFDEFAGKHKQFDGSGDVKYHQGFSSDIKTDNGSIHVALAFNPSHLEIVSPVVEGSVRARQERRKDTSLNQVIPIIIHGDSAFTGQGVVMETFNMSQTRGYKTGGTIHIVVNNQVGFTTSRTDDVRSTRYSTDIAKMVSAPIFHVNGDDPEAVVKIGRLALDYRMTFNKDVVIDMICYRRNGHNEADEPSATQPVMYKIIKKRPMVRKLYADKLIAAEIVTEKNTRELVKNYRDMLDLGKSVVAGWLPIKKQEFNVQWEPYLGQTWEAQAETALSEQQLKHYARVLTTVPAGFKLHPRVAKIINDRASMYKGEQPLDWGAAEVLAYAGTVDAGLMIRISGQDSGRGTFFHRHAVWHGQENGDLHIPLEHISQSQGNFTVIDSVLSEEAILAYEYGYSTTEPRSLLIWEGQFGDFANGAQVVIDQFISSGEHKWGRLSGLVMLLPHGYEGQGAEHSSARLERYLQLCAEENMQVCVPSTPAQVFHMLRRQALRPLRKPLIVMSPKSLLRHKLAVSELDDFTHGRFHTIIPEIDEHDPSRVSRVVMCSGKVYYDLLQKRRELGLDHVVIIRIEQLYPFPVQFLIKRLEPYLHVKEYIWCQEEPKNQGAWYCSQHNFKHCVPKNEWVEFAGREASAAPAAGSMSMHIQQQNNLVQQALGFK